MLYLCRSHEPLPFFLQHPDRHSGGTEEKKKEAETKFKEISDIFEMLTDPVKKKLYDQVYNCCCQTL